MSMKSIGASKILSSLVGVKKGVTVRCVIQRLRPTYVAQVISDFTQISSFDSGS